MGQNKFAAQFTQLCKNVVNYLQRTVLLEGYLIAKMVRMGKKQLIALPTAVDENGTDVNN